MASSGCEHHFLLMEELRPKEDLCVHMPESLSDKVKYSSTGFLKQKNVRMFSAGKVVEIICNHSLNKILMSATFMGSSCNIRTIQRIVSPKMVNRAGIVNECDNKR